jgi:flagellar L-ring protein precursor FlgH
MYKINKIIIFRYGFIASLLFLFNIFYALVLIFTLSSCADKPNATQIKILKQQTSITPKIITKRHKGTLYSQAGTSLFADKKDLSIGDIVQVTVDELLISNSNNKKDLTKTSTSTAGLTLGGNAKLDGSISSNSKFGFSGNAQNSVNEKFQTTVSAVIQERYTNGNYYILGHSQIVIDYQKQQLEISGIIRPYDITPDNTILSSQIADLKLQYSKTGTDSASTTQPWFMSFINFIWPF